MSTERQRCTDVDWSVHISDNGTISWEGAKLSVLMDIRAELKQLNRIIGCRNAIETFPTS